MKRIQTANELGGLWAAMPTPWTAAGGTDGDAISRNVERYASVPMDGVYTTDSDGEFYAIELDAFRTLVGSFSSAMAQTEMAASVGVTWCNTQGIVDRAKVAVDEGIPCVHVAFPFWMPLTRDDAFRFFDDLAEAVPEARWIHYNTPRALPCLTGEQYAQIHARHPDQLIGSKMSTMDVTVMTEILVNAPQLSHLATDYTTMTAMMFGAKGTCSYWANTLPRWTRRLIDHCLDERWSDAAVMQRRLLTWEVRHTKPLRDAGYLHGIVGKARAGLSNFLVDSGQTRPPYYSVREGLRHEFQKAFDDFWAAEE